MPAGLAQSVEPYSENPFRVLGVPSTASPKDVARGADRLLKWIELGETPPSSDALPFLGQLRLDRDKIKKAKQQIEEPKSRIRSELFWPSSNFAYSAACQNCLRNGQYKEFVAHCEYGISKEWVAVVEASRPTEEMLIHGQTTQHNPSLFANEASLQAKAFREARLAGSLARHHLAIFYHAAAIAVARKTARSVAGRMPPVEWDAAFRQWLAVQQDELFWEYLAQRATMLGDARLKAEHITALRSGLLRELLEVNAALGLEGLERGEYAELATQVKIIKSSPFNQQLLTHACEALVAPLYEQFERVSRDIQSKLTDKAILAFASTLDKASSGEGFVGTLDQEKLGRYLVEVERSINRRILPVANRVKEANLHNTGNGIGVLDGTAYLLRALCLALNNHAGLASEALRIAIVAQKYAASQECRERLLEDQRTLNYLSLQQEAAELAKARRFRESLAKLEQAFQFASTNEERRTIEEWKAEAKKLIAYEGVEPIDSAPSLSTVNGIGTMLYGRRDFDGTTNSYVSTLYFTFFFIPIFPIAAYRVVDAGANSYRFLGKVPLSRAAFAAPGILAALFLFAVASSSLDSSSSRSRSSPVVAPASSTRPSVPQGSSQPRAPKSAPGNVFSQPSQDVDGQAPGRRTTPDFSFGSERETLRLWIQRERVRISAEREELDRLDTLLSIEGNTLKERRTELERRQNLERLYGYGGPSDFEIDSYNGALRGFNRKAAALDARQARLQADIEEFNRKVNQYNSLR